MSESEPEENPAEIVHAGPSNLADVLERVLNTGIVIAGDIRVRLVDIELLTIQVRLVIASVETAKRELGMKWLESFNRPLIDSRDLSMELALLTSRIAKLEQPVVPNQADGPGTGAGTAEPPVPPPSETPAT